MKYFKNKAEAYSPLQPYKHAIYLLGHKKKNLKQVCYAGNLRMRNYVEYWNCPFYMRFTVLMYHVKSLGFN